MMLVPIAAVVIGLLLYFFATGRAAKWSEVGRLLYFAGILVLVYVLSAAQLTIAVHR